MKAGNDDRERGTVSRPGKMRLSGHSEKIFPSGPSVGGAVGPFRVTSGDHCRVTGQHDVPTAEYRQSLPYDEKMIPFKPLADLLHPSDYLISTAGKPDRITRLKAFHAGTPPRWHREWMLPRRIQQGLCLALMNEKKEAGTTRAPASGKLVSVALI